MNPSGTDTSLPWLLRGALCLPSPALVRREAALRFGELAQAADHAFPALLVPPIAAASSLLPEWRRAVAEELLLCSVLGLTVPDAITRRFATVRPLDSCELPLHNLIGRRAAVAMLPLATDTGAPECAHLWLIESPHNSAAAPTQWRRLPTTLELRGSRFSVHTVLSRLDASPIDGTSYQLALQLLKRALTHGHTGALHSLALDWIISGHIHNQLVTKIELGNKLDLPVQRRWLLPKENKGSIRSQTSFAPPRGVQFATTVDSAWNIVTGAGVVDEGAKLWPHDVVTLHSFVSSAAAPLLSCAMLTQPREIVLWHSGGTWRAWAQQLGTALRHFLPATRVSLATISSSNLAEAERTLKHALPPTSPADPVILFNITQGNRLMSFAALEAAKHNANLWLVYRDPDAPPFTFTMIRYEHDQTPHTYTIDGRANASACPGINWDKLFIYTPPNIRSARDIIADYSPACQKNASTPVS